jgi:hypothetical protein
LFLSVLTYLRAFNYCYCQKRSAFFDNSSFFLTFSIQNLIAEPGMKNLDVPLFYRLWKQLTGNPAFPAIAPCECKPALKRINTGNGMVLALLILNIHCKITACTIRL